jgi:hypothetical protein
MHMEVLTVARAEGIWWWRHGPEVDGVGSGFEKLRRTGAQRLVVVAGPGARWSGLAMERCPQWRKQTVAASAHSRVLLGGR